MKSGLLKKLPKVDELLKEKVIQNEMKNGVRSIVVDTVRETLNFYRQGILKGKINDFSVNDILKTFTKLIKKKNLQSLRKVINGTGVVVHTNLGRSLLSKKAIDAVINVTENYNNLEYDIASGKRGLRYIHVERLIKRITGAEAAVVVNNNAAAVMLVLNTLCSDKEAIISRGELVEIGGSFRIPEVMKYSGTKLVEVGTTNRTHLYDYENNINENTGILLKVHTSNYKIMGFTQEVPLEDLVSLGKKYGIPTYEDIGSGVLIDYSKYGLSHEPTVQESIKKGIDIVSFSGDKMLGGPQAGIIVGKKEYIDKMKKNQLTRALRVDKMTLAALEATLKYYFDEDEAVNKIPTVSMILMPKEKIKKKAQKLRRKLVSKVNNFKFEIVKDYSMVGGGAMPTEKLETYAIKITPLDNNLTKQQLQEKLRLNDTPIIVRVNNDDLMIDLRTVFESDFDDIVMAFKNIE